MMKYSWQKVEIFIYTFFTITVLFFQSSNFFHENFLFKTIKPNFLYVACVWGVFRYSWQFLMMHTLLIGFFLDCISVGTFGVYMISYFCSIIPMIWIRKWVLQLQLSIFLLVLLLCYTIKSVVDVVIVTFLYGGGVVFLHLLQTSIPEILLTIPLGGMCFFVFWIQKFLCQRVWFYFYSRVGRSKNS